MYVYVGLQLSDPEKCDQMYESLARINSNMYKEKVRHQIRICWDFQMLELMVVKFIYSEVYYYSPYSPY